MENNDESSSNSEMSSLAPRLRIGYAISPKKEETFILSSLINHATQRGIDLIRIEPAKPLIEQAPFDCIIHKLYNSGWPQQLLEFSTKHPNVVIIDPPEAIERLHSREFMLEVVKQLEKPPQGSETFGIPNQRVVHDPEILLGSNAIKELGLEFPVIAKQLSADGSANSHKMCLVFNEKGLKKLNTPIVLQEYVNHGGVVFKVYVVGKHVKCVKRKSLSDISEETLKLNRMEEGGLLSFSKISNLAWNDEEEVNCEVEMPRLEFVMELARGLREAMGLRIFNFDVIRDWRDKDRYFVIDINYFPGYAKMPSYESVLVDFFLEIVRERKEGQEVIGNQHHDNEDKTNL